MLNGFVTSEQMQPQQIECLLASARLQNVWMAGKGSGDGQRSLPRRERKLQLSRMSREIVCLGEGSDGDAKVRGKALAAGDGQ